MGIFTVLRFLTVDIVYNYHTSVSLVIRKELPLMFHKKFLYERNLYFLIFTVLSLLFIVNGYATLATNDDWALRGLLAAKDIYGTLIMSYPLSYVMSHLYDFFPSLPWYSLLLSLVIWFNFYFVALYIEKNDSYLQKAIIFVLALLWLTYLWFNASITVLTITTMLSAVGFIRKELLLSFIFIFLASLLRTDMMIIFIPFYLVAFFILREKLTINKHEIYGLILLISLVASSLFIQKQDHVYTDWLVFNKARASVADLGSSDTKKILSSEEMFFLGAGWVQDSELLPTDKVIASSPVLSDILQRKVQNIHFIDFLKIYKFRYWLWLLFAASFIVILLNIKSRKALFIPFFAFGVILLIITRDVDRVTVPLVMMWAYILSESLKSNRIVNTIFLFLFTYLFYSYSSAQLGYRYFTENTLLQKEARQLIGQSGKICEPSMSYPTGLTMEVINVFRNNYLFYEDNWLKLNDKEILPAGWLSRHELFYIAHNLSDANTKRKYSKYYDFLIDDETAFFGSKMLIRGGNSKILLDTYDKLHLKDRPNCRHKAFIVAESEHFAISQIKVDCNATLGAGTSVP